MLTCRLQRSNKAKHGLLLYIERGDKIISVAKPLDIAHARAIQKRFEAWAAQGWPYHPKGLEQ